MKNKLKGVVVLIKIEDILSENYSSYPEESRSYMEKFNESLRENIQEELTQDIRDKVMSNVEKDKDYLMDVLTEILEKGCKGYNSKSTRALLNEYLAKKNEKQFAKLIDKVSKEVEE